MHMVFVYGTLKRGFPNYNGWMEQNHFAGLYKTRDPFPLIVGGQWFSPIMIGEPGCGHQVTGELFEVDDAGLAKLDVIESIHVKTGYDRIAIMVDDIETDTSLEAWTYVKKRSVIEIIHEELTGEYRFDTRYTPASRR